MTAGNLPAGGTKIKAATCTEPGRLNGKTAIVSWLDGKMYAQFDDLSLPEAYGWWVFPESSFTVEEK